MENVQQKDKNLKEKTKIDIAKSYHYEIGHQYYVALAKAIDKLCVRPKQVI